MIKTNLYENLNKGVYRRLLIFIRNLSRVTGVTLFVELVTKGHIQYIQHIIY